MKDITFGTDGWRGLIADNFTFANVRILMQATADYFIKKNKNSNNCRIVVGYDRRFLSKEYAHAACEVLAANGIKTILANEAAPTPAMTLFIKKRKLSGGIVVTASHNPPNFNGIKIKTEHASSAAKNVTSGIERLLGRVQPKTLNFSAARKNKLIDVHDIKKDYTDFIGNYIDFSIIKSKKLNILIDYMYGASSGILEQLLGNTSASIEALNTQRDVLFGGVSPEPVPKNLEFFLRHTKKTNPDLAIAIDGDGDRIAAAGAKTGYINSGQIISLILLHFLINKKIKGIVVKTISGTSLIDEIARDYGLEVLETPIGFKHISEIMQKQDVLIGGEESGGIGFKGYIPERDGLVSALFLLEMIALKNKNLDQILAGVSKRYGSFFYNRIDIKIKKICSESMMLQIKKHLSGTYFKDQILQIKTYDGIKFILKDKSWLLIRASGTEPVLRIYAESSNKSKLNKLLNIGERAVLKWNKKT